MGLKINFIGNFSQGYVGEIADETHLARELEELGHKVNKIPRDIWKAYVDGAWDENWKKYIGNHHADINIVCKWHHFNKGAYIKHLKEETSAPVFYWVWDWMDGFPHGHKEMVEAADLYISNDVFHPQYKNFENCYYFPFDVADGEIKRFDTGEYKYDVTFFGSCIPQGDRKEWLKEIAKHCNLSIFSWNPQEWQKIGLTANSAVYGDEFSRTVAQTKICLQLSVNDHTWGYWSNRVGKILTLGGFLLARYVPGMELFLRDSAEYFSNPEEAIKKIDFYLKNDDERNKIANRGYGVGRERFTSKERIKDLSILIERYLAGAI